MKTELQRLRDQKEKYEELIQEKDIEIEELNDVIYSLEKPDAIDHTGILDTETLDKKMMFEKLQANWHIISQSDVDAICPL